MYICIYIYIKIENYILIFYKKFCEKLKCVFLFNIYYNTSRFGLLILIYIYTYILYIYIIQITQQHNKSKLKNTYRIKEIIVKGKI